MSRSRHARRPRAGRMFIIDRCMMCTKLRHRCRAHQHPELLREMVEFVALLSAAPAAVTPDVVYP